MMKEILVSKDYSDIRLIVVISTLITFLLWIKDSLEISCLLSLFQNVILVIFITLRLLNRMSIDKFHRIKIGILVGGCLGILYSTTTIIVEDVRYYFFGGRLQTSKDLGLPFFPLTKDLFLTELISGFWVWFFFVIVSIGVGFIAGIVSRGEKVEK